MIVRLSPSAMMAVSTGLVEVGTVTSEANAINNVQTTIGKLIQTTQNRDVADSLARAQIQLDAAYLAAS